MSSPTLLPQHSCWICGGTSLNRWNEEIFDMTWQIDPVIKRYHDCKFWLSKCSACSFIQPESLPSESDFFDRLYSKDRGSDWMEEEYTSPYRDLIFQGICRQLKRRLSTQHPTLLDVGTHVGRMLLIAKQFGFQPSGIELNPAVAAFAAARTGVQVVPMNAHQLYQTGQRFDAITLSDVLEHIPSPLVLLAELHKLLQPGGWISVKVPFGQNQWRKEWIRTKLGKIPAPWIATNMVHVNHFSPDSLKLALEKVGFTKILVTVGAPELPPAKGSWKATVGLWFRRFCYGVASLPGMVHTPMAFNLQAFAQVPKEQTARV